MLCVGEEGLPAALLLQTGPQSAGLSHFHSEAAFHRSVSPVLALANLVARSCKRTLHIFWTGLTSQVKAMDVKYPDQAGESARRFNDEIWSRIANNVAQNWSMVGSVNQGVRRLDFYNLTDDALTYDGYHQLTDSNLAKANVLLSALELLLFEGQHNAPKAPGTSEKNTIE